jgi:hypothetical protein
MSNNLIIDGLKEILEKEWVGKRFVYISKYGSETIGEIESVRIGIEMTFDSDSNRVIKNLVDIKSKNQPNMRNIHEMSAINNHEKENSFKWIGTRPNISIFSTKGQMYELNEIYILNDETDEK